MNLNLKTSESVDIQKYTIENMGVLNHNKRDNDIHANKNINANYTKDNRNLLKSDRHEFQAKEYIMSQWNKTHVKKDGTAFKFPKDTKVAFALVTTFNINDEIDKNFMDVLNNGDDKEKKLTLKLINKWAEKSTQHFTEFFKNYNVISADLHMDEINPHIHFVFSGMNNQTNKFDITKGFKFQYKKFRENFRTFTETFCKKNKIDFVTSKSQEKVHYSKIDDFKEQERIYRHASDTNHDMLMKYTKREKELKDELKECKDRIRYFGQLGMNDAVDRMNKELKEYEQEQEQDEQLDEQDYEPPKFQM